MSNREREGDRYHSYDPFMMGRIHIRDVAGRKFLNDFGVKFVVFRAPLTVFREPTPGRVLVFFDPHLHPVTLRESEGDDLLGGRAAQLD